ncbi:MAG: hypothetical protein QOC96_730 [Acidobacteriota bacterium]|jgi:hypothetical protein|nr:hypothetical protein [Acidobacteriota bacterium]
MLNEGNLFANAMPKVEDLQASVQDKTGFTELEHYRRLGVAYLTFLAGAKLTRIISPTPPHNYIFYQYGRAQANKITRPLNGNLFIESPLVFAEAFDRFVAFLADLKKLQEKAEGRRSVKAYLASNEINKVIYTAQQSIGCIGDSFKDSNQARKRIGQLFERLIKLIILEVGLECEPRTISVPVPSYPGYAMPYELDVVFSRNKAVLVSETKTIHPMEIVGSVKTTSKDRIDKIFLDKYLLAKLLGRDIPVVAVFLHDVQRAKKGNSIFGIASTFKTNHFLCYSLVLSKLDGVYYVDPRPEMVSTERLREQISDFQHFLTTDLWTLSAPVPTKTHSKI